MSVVVTPQDSPDTEKNTSASAGEIPKVSEGRLAQPDESARELRRRQARGRMLASQGRLESGYGYSETLSVVMSDLQAKAAYALADVVGENSGRVESIGYGRFIQHVLDDSVNRPLGRWWHKAAEIDAIFDRSNPEAEMLKFARAISAIAREEFQSDPNARFSGTTTPVSYVMSKRANDLNQRELLEHAVECAGAGQDFKELYVWTHEASGRHLDLAGRLLENAREKGVVIEAGGRQKHTTFIMAGPMVLLDKPGKSARENVIPEGVYEFTVVDGKPALKPTDPGDTGPPYGIDFDGTDVIPADSVVRLDEPGKSRRGAVIPEGTYRFTIFRRASALTPVDSEDESPYGVDLSKTKMTLTAPAEAPSRLWSVLADICRHTAYAPKSRLPESDPDAVVFGRGGYVWLAESGPNHEPPGLYRFSEDNKGVRYITSYEHDIPLNTGISRRLAPVRNLQKEAIEALGAGEGWKLHLNFDYRSAKVRAAVNDALAELMTYGVIANFKIGHGGGVESGQPGKEATVYVGHGYAAKKVAEYLEEKSAEYRRVRGVPLLEPPEGDALHDDMTLTPHVAGRFDIRAHEFHQYGLHGVPFLNADMGMNARHKGEDAREFADRILRERYGVFYTAGFEGSVRPN